MKNSHNLKFSIIIPVFREPGIQAAIDKLYMTQSSEDFEVIVVDGEAETTSLKSISSPSVVQLSSAKGRAVQMNKGALAARGEILIFLHSDTLLPENCLQAIASALSAVNVKAGAFDLDFDSKGGMMQVIGRVASLRSRLTRIPYGDQVHFFNREYFLAIGLYRKMAIFEDVEIMSRIRKRGERIIILAAKATTSARTYRQKGALLTALRNIMLQLFYLCGVPAKTLERLYYN